ncbi:MAG: SpaA isopeptide-forming pilin-related protein [Eubacterium sp.]
MKQSKKLMCILLSLIITLSAFLPCVSAFAATVEECKLSIRTSTKYKYMNNWAYPNNRNGIHLATVKNGTHKGEVAYCIEFGKDMGDDGQEETITDIDKVPAWEEFNASQKAGITRATIYGYPNFNYGVSDEAAQVATQFVVWEYSQGYRTSADGDNPTAGLNGTSSKIENAIDAAGFDVRQQYYKSGVLEYSDVETAYKAILNGIKNHKVIPSFNSDTIELNWNSKNERFEASVTDTKKVLSLYEISSKNSSLKFSKSGNTLTIYTSDVLSSATEVTMTKTCAKVGADIGFVPPNQNVNQSLVGRLTDPVTAKFTVKTATGNLKISKSSEDEIIKNIAFTVEGNGKTYNVTTDANGNAELKNIPVGTYQVYEGDILRYVKQATKSVTVTDGKTATVSFKNELKKGNIKIQKNSEDSIVKDFTFKVTGSDGSTYSAKTNADGIATITDVPVYDSNNKKIVYTVQETNIPVRYVTPDNQTVTLEADKTSTVTFNNILKKFRVKVVKSDIEKGHAQGDAKLSGAVYGIYKGNQLIDTYTTDDNASFTTKYYICDTDWTIKEISASEGYLVNDKVYKVGADPALFTVELNNINLDVVEMPIKGKIAIIKHTDDGSTQIETPEKGAEFQVYLKSSGSYVNADKDEHDTIVCDEDGFASTKLMPYGVYTVHQTKGWDGREKIKDFDVYISKDGKTYKFLINNANFESYLKVVKLDKETEKQIAYEGAAFEIYNADGHRVNMQFTYPDVTSIHTFYTNSEGYLITPEKLPYGDYSLKEVQAPYGYVLDSTPIPFTVTQENASTDTGVTVIKVKDKDMAQKGVIEITKQGEIFSSVGVLGGGYIDENGNDVEFPITYNPIYETKNLANAVFQIYAAEDITTLDGTVRAQQGELVDEITTGKDGIAKSKQLYLGKYTVIEKTAPNTFYNANEQYDVELTYAGQNVSVTSTAISVYNERQKVSVSLEKIMEQNKTFGIGMNNEILSVQFGIFADEDITAADGSMIPKDALITYGNCDENGKLTFNCDLPIGYKFYAKEMAADEHYILSNAHYTFDTEYQGQAVQTINIDLNSGQKIENELIYGTVKGLKIDRETEKTIKGALFGLFKSDETEYVETNAILTATSDENGIFTFNNLPYGSYIIKELKPAESYLTNEEIYPVQIDTNEQIIEITVVNDHIPELKTTATVNGDKEICATEVFTLVDTVEYQHLIPNKEYVLKGVLMDKNTGEPLLIDGAEVHSETVFIPTEPSGTATVEFTFDSKYIKSDTDIVVFESLYKDGKELAVHADIEDEGQTVTVKVPEIKTTAKVNGKKEITAKGEITIKDIVSFTNLTPDKEYTIKGVLMDKSTGKAFEIDGKPVTSEVTFISKKSNGKVNVEFTFDSSGIKTNTELVVFETLYRDGIELTAHADINDKGQTVKLTMPVIKTPKTSDNSNRRTIATVMGASAFGILSLAYYLIKKKKSNKGGKA